MLSLTIACNQQEQPVAAGRALTPPPAAAVVAAPAASSGQISGRVLETMNAAGYTYILLQTSSGEVWAAVRETEVAKGSTVVIEPQMVAEKFESASLKKTFDKLVMGSLASGGAPSAEIETVKVERAGGGKTIAETWSERTKLSNREVTVRGKVVKFLPQIMGKNWVHLRDGSGSREAADDDLTITTTDVVSAGDTVTATGTLRIDKDFGSGYRYPVIIEDAKVRKDAP